jgi:hypothetical protein
MTSREFITRSDSKTTAGRHSAAASALRRIRRAGDASFAQLDVAEPRAVHIQLRPDPLAH